MYLSKKDKIFRLEILVKSILENSDSDIKSLLKKWVNDEHGSNNVHALEITINHDDEEDVYSVPIPDEENVRHTITKYIKNRNNITNLGNLNIKFIIYRGDISKILPDYIKTSNTLVVVPGISINGIKTYREFGIELNDDNV